MATVLESTDISTIRMENLTHPEYNAEFSNWEKWRRTFRGGDSFIQYYLEKYTTREDDTDFTARKNMTYVPAFAKAAITDVKNSIFQRIADVTREGGTTTYEDAVRGSLGGVDLAGTTMGSFIGTTLLPELLVMGRVGVFVDMPKLRGITLHDQEGIRPYAYFYPIEHILNWVVDDKNNKTYSRLLLKDYDYTVDPVTQLPIETEESYRFIWVEDEKVHVQFYDKNSEPITRGKQPGTDIITLDVPTIPFVSFEIADSLMRDVANYQIALLALASSDMAYAVGCNFPLYVEAYDPRADNLFRRTAGVEKVHSGDDSVAIVQGGERADAVIAKNREVQVGTTIGRRIPRGLEYPKFVHPSSEPLQASMGKQEVLKKEIRMLVNLAVTSLSDKMASAESKDYDERGLEAGLSAIGLELERGEKQIAELWRMYEGGTTTATVKYPKRYSLQSSIEKRQEARDLLDMTKTIPSTRFRKEAYKHVVGTVLGAQVAYETLNEMRKEIDAANVIVNPEELHRDIELGLIDLEAASKAKGYPNGAVDKAAEDHAARVRRIAESQAKARGASELSGIANASRDEKMSKETDTAPKKKTRS